MWVIIFIDQKSKMASLQDIRKNIKNFLWNNNILLNPLYINKNNNKLSISEQSYKGKVKTHYYINRQNRSTTAKLWKWPLPGTGISKEMVVWIIFQSAKPPALITVQRFQLNCRLQCVCLYMNQKCKLFWLED